MKTLEDIRRRSAQFAHDRGYEPLQTPKNLAMALSVEAAELLELFQWLSAEQSLSLDADAREAVAEELADVMLYLVRLADVLDIDILQAVADKADKNELKYPLP